MFDISSAEGGKDGKGRENGKRGKRGKHGKEGCFFRFRTAEPGQTV